MGWETVKAARPPVGRREPAFDKPNFVGDTFALYISARTRVEGNRFCLNKELFPTN